MSPAPGIVYGTGERWQQLRCFAIVTLKSFGMGKRGAEDRVCEEAQPPQGQPFDPTFLLSCTGSNIICWLVFGERFEYGDERFLALMGLINTNWKLMSSTWGQLLFIFLNIMRFVPGPHRQIYTNYLRLAKFVGEWVWRNRQMLDPQNPWDFIDCFLLKMQQVPTSSLACQTSLQGTAINLFFEGTETVSSALKYGLRILLRHPEVEARLHEEIDQVIGRHCSPCMEDRSCMPYVDAVIHEIYSTPASLPTPRPLTLHTLDEKGCFKRNDAFMAFSTDRVCLGEGLAVMELFIFLTSILQHFQLKATINITPESRGLGNVPQPYRLSLIPR
uniref:Uncharacterized protein n=1 Tax=Buteo japonicus TaxID=224669 RepID=A0A8C0BDT3_9AVES